MARRPNFDAEQAARKLLGGEDHLATSDWQLVSTATWDSEGTDEQRLAALALIDALRRDVDTYERRLLEKLRDDEPVPWTGIAAALGVTRQGAERRYLRATASGARYADRGRQDERARRETADINRRLGRARWGRAEKAARDWHVELRVRTRAGTETTTRLEGYADDLPDLRSLVKIGDSYDTLYHLQVLEVIEEVTPWPDVDPPGTLVGLGVDQQ